MRALPWFIMIEWSLLAKIAVLVLGAGVFLRLAAKDVRRRDKYLLIRLEEENHEAELEENRRKLEQDAAGSRKRPSDPSPR
jgi:hypothetical protein